MTSNNEVEDNEQRDDILKLNEEENLGLEAVDLDENQNDNDDLGLEFNGEVMNLDEESQKNRTPVYLTAEQEEIEKVSASVYKLPIKKEDKTIQIVEPSKGKIKRSFITYYNYYLLNNMFVDYYEKNKHNPKTIYVNVDYQFRAEMIKLIKGYVSHLNIEDTEDRTHVL